MKKIITATGLVALLATSAAAQDRPDGWQSMSCDGDQFTAVLLSNGEVAYWTNPTCPASANGRTEAGPTPAVIDDDDDYTPPIEEQL